MVGFVLCVRVQGSEKVT